MLRSRTRKAFTLIELLVVIAIIALLLSILMPSLGKAKALAKAVVCASQVRQIQIATVGYTMDNSDNLAFFGASTNSTDKGPFWFELYAPYLANNNDSSADFYEGGAYNADFRKCPAGKWTQNDAMPDGREWNCWIGVNFGIGNNNSYPLKAPYFYRISKGNLNPALKVIKVQQPSEAMAYIDTARHYVYSPLNQGPYKFDTDYDGDGLLDTSRQVSVLPYNEARPKVHGDGTNVGLLDGHVERVKFKNLWEINEKREVVHPYWKIKSR